MHFFLSSLFKSQMFQLFSSEQLEIIDPRIVFDPKD